MVHACPPYIFSPLLFSTQFQLMSIPQHCSFTFQASRHSLQHPHLILGHFYFLTQQVSEDPLTISCGSSHAVCKTVSNVVNRSEQ